MIQINDLSPPPWESLTNEQRQSIAELYSWEQQTDIRELPVFVPPPVPAVVEFVSTVAPPAQELEEPELNPGTVPHRDSAEALERWYYTGRASDRNQIAHGLIPPRETTPWGLQSYIEARAYDMERKAYQLVDEQIAQSEAEGLTVDHAERRDLEQFYRAEVSNQVRSADQQRMEAWQQGQKLPEIDLFGKRIEQFTEQFTEEEKEQPPLSAADRIKAKLERIQEQFGVKEISEKSWEIER